MKRLLTLLVVLAATLLAACGDETAADSTTGDTTPAATDAVDSDDVGDSVSPDGTWQLTGVSIDGSALVLPPYELTITIADGMIQGNAGCNTFGGTIDRGEDGSLALGDLAQTEMACEYLDFEIDYTTALLRADRWEATPDELAFVADGVRISYQPGAE